jgi:hypothetical protein
MNISKRQLRRLIKEETAKVLHEQADQMGGSLDAPSMGDIDPEELEYAIDVALEDLPKIDQGIDYYGGSMDPGDVEDSASLQFIKDEATKQLAAGQAASDSLYDQLNNMDTVVREYVPKGVIEWIDLS